MKIFLVVTEPVVEASSWSFGGTNLYNDIIIVSLVIVMLTLLFSAVVINRAMKAIVRLTMPHLQSEEVKVAKEKVKGPSTWERLVGLRPIEEEKDLVMDHEFDGIVELNNPVPVWFNVLFYGTIFFGLIYFFIYQISGWGLNQDQEYAVEMQKAEVAKQAYLAKAGNQVDESTVVFNESYVAEGKAIFATNCATCHKADGSGDAGPNLTDRFWIHGGEIKDIFKVVKYGVPAMGMIAWEDQLSPLQIAQVSSYIVTLRDTNPPNPKAPQGVEVVYEGSSAEGDVAQQDTLAN
jgi:cytochrome c oxidase cbb3-type subunit III